jgi:hypothetical protein
METPVKNTPKVQYEYLIKDKKLSSTPVIFGIDNSITKPEESDFSTSRKFLIESITEPSKRSFVRMKMLEITTVLLELNMDPEKLVSTAIGIIEECTINDKLDLVISKTAQNELLFYRKEGNHCFNNLLIDEDGDISFLKIGNSESDTKVRFFSNDSNLNIKTVVDLL